GHDRELGPTVVPGIQLAPGGTKDPKTNRIGTADHVRGHLPGGGVSSRLTSGNRFVIIGVLEDLVPVGIIDFDVDESDVQNGRRRRRATHGSLYADCDPGRRGTRRDGRASREARARGGRGRREGWLSRED